MNTRENFYKKQLKIFQTRLCKELEYSENLKREYILEKIQRKLYEDECERLKEKLNKSFFKRLFDFK